MSWTDERVELLKKLRKIVDGESFGGRGVGSVPVFLRGGSGIERGERHDRKLRGAEGRIEALVDGIAFPASLRPLGRKEGLDRDSQVLIGLRTVAGFSQRQLAAPVLIAAVTVMVITWVSALWLMPLGQRALSAKVLDISADIGAALLNAGEFETPAKGLTVFIHQIGNNGQITGILVHDNRDNARPITYIAQRGVLAQTVAGSRLIMYDGTVEESAARGAQLSVLTFKNYSFDLDQFAGPTRTTFRKTNERFLGELINPPEQGTTLQVRTAWLAEAHSRLSQPLYCLAFAMIALAAILRGRRQRGALAMRLTGASLAAAGLRIAGYGVAGPAATHPSLFVLFYLIPLIGAGLAWLVLMGWSPAALIARRTTAEAAA